MHGGPHHRVPENGFRSLKRVGTLQLPRNRESPPETTHRTRENRRYARSTSPKASLISTHKIRAGIKEDGRKFSDRQRCCRWMLNDEDGPTVAEYSTFTRSVKVNGLNQRCSYCYASPTHEKCPCAITWVTELRRREDFLTPVEGVLVLTEERARRATKPSTAVSGRPSPSRTSFQRLDGTGRHAADGTRHTRKDGDGGQPKRQPRHYSLRPKS
ncbi:hypothetical protein B0H10DRAFT_1958412 [Mycena sp. CBHHK59/15]|nr:hypothetical protein B0H10DRAFT_1958412 [Mycena sp. CBHHK59/15]